MGKRRFGDALFNFKGFVGIEIAINIHRHRFKPPQNSQLIVINIVFRLTLYGSCFVFTWLEPDVMVTYVTVAHVMAARIVARMLSHACCHAHVITTDTRNILQHLRARNIPVGHTVFTYPNTPRGHPHLQPQNVFSFT